MSKEKCEISDELKDAIDKRVRSFKLELEAFVIASLKNENPEYNSRFLIEDIEMFGAD